mmetsp:Transcript_15818/g.23802  ORF Transcript_15818/g.23802 Transcript_15818/m.23802 type:complete len:222 (+) Transcript_15818:1926-2591(+)
MTVSACSSYSLRNIHECLCGIKPKHSCRNSNVPSRWLLNQSMSQHDGNMTIESHRLIKLVLKHIKVVQPIRLFVLSGRRRRLRKRGRGGTESQGRGMLRYAIYLSGMGKGKVHSNRHWSLWLSISMSTKRFLPVTRELTPRSILFSGIWFNSLLLSRAISINCKPVFTVVDHFFATMSIHLILHRFQRPSVRLGIVLLFKVHHTECISRYGQYTISVHLYS